MEDYRKRANENYRKKTKSINLVFTTEEMELFEFAKSVPNTNGFVKSLIRYAKEAHTSPKNAFDNMQRYFTEKIEQK